MAEKPPALSGLKPEAPVDAALADRSQHDSAAPLSTARRRGQRPGIAETIRLKREAKIAHREQHGDGWAVRKFTVGLVVLFFGYSTYAFVARVCVPLVQQQPGHPGSRAQGGVYLAIYWLLWIMFVWTYLMVVFTSPGEVRKLFTETQTPPEEPASQRRDSESQRSVYYRPPTAAMPHAPSQQDVEMAEDATAEDATAVGAFGPIGSLAVSSAPNDASQEPWLVASSSAPLDPPEHVQTIRPTRSEAHSEATDVEKADAPLERTPPTVPILHPYYRWCRRCERVKPYRAHHCRHCGTCVLGMDHHCPWVGHCVGSRNLRYFNLFVLWASIYCIFVLVVTAIDLFPPGGGRDLDGQELALIVIAALFAFFTLGMVMTQIPLVLSNTSTIEALAAAHKRERENYRLARAFPWWDCRSRSQIRRRWDETWGHFRTEANLWWLGSRRANFEAAMGKGKLGWILPIPIRDGRDGLSYPVNPRFTPDGVQRPREHWPAELR